MIGGKCDVQPLALEGADDGIDKDTCLERQQFCKRSRTFCGWRPRSDLRSDLNRAKSSTAGGQASNSRSVPDSLSGRIAASPGHRSSRSRWDPVARSWGNQSISAGQGQLAANGLICSSNSSIETNCRSLRTAQTTMVLVQPRFQLHTSTLRPGTFEKCLRLFVTTVISWETACAAMRRSIFPIGLPERSNSVRIRA
jgi:hypothetical protein